MTPDQVREALRLVIDPELGVNVIDLGLVYDIDIVDGGVRVSMTMTTRACPLGESLAEQAEAAIRENIPGVTSASVDLVWEPPWRPSMMSDAARARLG